LKNASHNQKIFHLAKDPTTQDKPVDNREVIEFY
jgi:hypothetical protein